MSLKNRRYKPYFKSFTKLRENITGNPKLLKFKKKKWRALVNRLSKVQRRRSYRRRNFHHVSHQISRNAKPLKVSFRVRTSAKKKLNIFYGKFTEKKLKSFFKDAFFDSKTKHKGCRKEDLLIANLEGRLDSTLFRAHFFKSFRQTRQFITHGGVYVNGRLELSASYKTQPGDVIEILKEKQELVRANVLTSKFFPFPPRYLEIDFTILTIVVVEEINAFKVPFLFPFWLNLKTIFAHYQL